MFFYFKFNCGLIRVNVYKFFIFHTDIWYWIIVSGTELTHAFLLRFIRTFKAQTTVELPLNNPENMQIGEKHRNKSKTIPFRRRNCIWDPHAMTNSLLKCCVNLWIPRNINKKQILEERRAHDRSGFGSVRQGPIYKNHNQCLNHGRNLWTILDHWNWGNLAPEAVEYIGRTLWLVFGLHVRFDIFCDSVKVIKITKLISLEPNVFVKLRNIRNNKVFIVLAGHVSHKEA